MGGWREEGDWAEGTPQQCERVHPIKEVTHSRIEPHQPLRYWENATLGRSGRTRSCTKHTASRFNQRARICHRPRVRRVYASDASCVHPFHRDIARHRFANTSRRFPRQLLLTIPLSFSLSLSLSLSLSIDTDPWNLSSLLES